VREERRDESSSQSSDVVPQNCSRLEGVLLILLIIIVPQTVVIMLFPRVEEDVLQDVSLLFEGLQVLASPGEPPAVVERLVQEEVIVIVFIVQAEAGEEVVKIEVEEVFVGVLLVVVEVLVVLQEGLVPQVVVGPPGVLVGQDLVG
jgi:hypothetical protein